MTGALVGLLVVLAGCGSGELAATSTQVSFPGGASGEQGAIAVRDAAFVYPGPTGGAAVYPRGATAPLEATFINQGTAADRLVAISSPIAEGGSVLGTGTIPGQHTLAAGSPGAAPPGATTAALSLTGLRGEIRAGLTYPVVFTFARAGDLTIELPVANPDTR